MPRPSRAVRIAAAVVFTTAATPALAQDLVVNGSFEEPVVSGFGIFPSIPGWTASSGPGIEVQRSVAGSPAGGAQHVELDSAGPSAAYQDVATVPGAAYRLRLRYSPRPGVADNRIEVLWDGASVDLLDADGTGLPDTVWTRREYVLVAATTSTRIELADRSVPDSLGGYLDEVCLTRDGLPCMLVLAVRFDSFALTRRQDRAVEARFTTASEDGTLGFRLERARVEDGPDGPFTAAGAPIRARGPGHPYVAIDAGPGAGAPGWYRIAEVTADGDGAGDRTGALPVEGAGPEAEGGRRARSGPRGRPRRSTR